MTDDPASGQSAGLGEPDQREAPAAVPEEESGAVPGRRRLDRRLLVGVGAVVAVVVLAVMIVVSRGSDSPGPREDLNVGALATPKTTHDPVPRGPIITKRPAACGVPDATARELVPGFGPSGKDREASSAGACFWHAVNDGEAPPRFVRDSDTQRKRVLTVDIDLNETIGEAVRRLVALPRRGRVVTGLAEEAWAEYSPDHPEGKTYVHFRVRNATVLVEYGGWDRKGKDSAKRPLPENAAITGAFKAAAEIAKNLGAPTPSTPSFTLPRETAPLIRRLPNPCETVSEDTLPKVANGAYHRRGSDAPFESSPPFEQVPAVKVNSCFWNARTPDSPDGSARFLAVTIATATERQPGTATQLATREYLRQHHNARDSWDDGADDRQHGFTALKGLGDQAFAHRVNVVEPTGRVVFRLRNVLVVVRYLSNSHDRDPLTTSEAINGAYTVGLDVAESLSHP